MSLIIAKPTKPMNAQEAKDSNEFKVGDKVRYSYSVHGADVDDIFKVVKVIDYQKVIIKRIRDGKEWDEFDYNLVAVKNSAQDADISEPKSANGKVLKVGSLVVPASMKEKRRELARVVVRVEGKDPKYGFGPFVFLKGQSGAFDPAWLYAFDGCAADSAAQDRGNYATNTIALLRTALGNLRTADSVVRRALSNIDDAMRKVQDAQAKSSLKSMLQEWWECEREIWDTMEKVQRISVPSGHGVPNKAKLSPEDRAFIKEFFE